ncbi:MAG: hypothetical protein HRF49_09610 [bacterium]
MEKPKIAVLNAGLDEVRARWSDADRHEKDVIYAREFGPKFARLFSRLPVDGHVGDFPKVKHLVSVLGLSWQPAALLAAKFNPDKHLIIGTAESLAVKVAGEDVIDVISRVSGLSRNRLEVVKVRPPEERGIYRAVNDFCRENEVSPGRIVVDPTGGKKTMSLAAALAAFLMGALIVYVDYAEYDAALRMPLAGTEYPRLVTNPLIEFGTLELRKIEYSFNACQFDLASRAASEFKDKSHFEHLGAALGAMCAGYGAWNRFEFKEARGHLQKLRSAVEKYGPEDGWVWARRIYDGITAHIEALVRLETLQSQSPDFTGYSAEDAGLVCANHFASAKRAFAAGGYSSSVLLAYSSLERAFGFALLLGHGLNPSKIPESCLDTGELDLFHSAGREIFEDKYTEMPLLLMPGFAQRFMLLCAKNGRLFGKLKHSIQDLRKLMNVRNGCEFEHGMIPKPIDKAAADKLLVIAERVLKVVSDEYGFEFDGKLKQLSFPVVKLGA